MIEQSRKSLPRQVVVVGQRPPPVHGSNLVCDELIVSLERAGISVTFIEKRFSEQIEQVGKANLGKALRVPRFFAQALRECPSETAPVIYFVSLTPASFLVDALCIQMLLRLRRSPLILYVHGVGFRALSEKGPVVAGLVARTLRSSQAVVSLTESLKDDVAPWTSARQRFVIANPVPGGDSKPAPIASEPNFLFLSNLVIGKGPDTFLRAAAHVARKNSNATFSIAGASYDADTDALLERLAANSALDGRLRVVGPAAPEVKLQLFATCSVLVFPSRLDEAAPLTILEAKRAGRGVLASNVGGIKDLVHPGVDGALIADGDPLAWGEAMLAIAGEPETAKRWGQAARRDYELRFTDRVFDEAWMELLSRFGHNARATGKR